MRAASIEHLGKYPLESFLIVTAGACMAFGFNLSNYFYVKLTSAVTTTIASNGVKVRHSAGTRWSSGVVRLRHVCVPIGNVCVVVPATGGCCR